MTDTLSVLQGSILALSTLCIGMSKTGVQGLMLLIVPYMAMAFGAKESTGIIFPMLCMADMSAHGMDTCLSPGCYNMDLH